MIVPLGRKLPAKNCLDLRKASRQALRLLSLPEAAGKANRVVQKLLGVAIARRKLRAGSASYMAL